MTNAVKNYWHKWKVQINNLFPDPENVYAALKPLFFATSFFGLTSYGQIRQTDKKLTYRRNKWLLISNVLKAVFFVASTFLIVQYKSRRSDENDMKSKLQIFQDITSLVLSAVEILFSCIFARKIIRIFRNIEEIDDSFKILAVWISYKKIYIQIIFQLIGCFFLFILLTWCNIHTMEYTLDVVTISIAFILLPYILNILMEFQYCTYLNIIHLRFKVLNEYLEALVRENRSYNGWMLSNNNDEKPIVQTPIPKYILKSITTISEPVYVVHKVAAFHIKLTDTAIMINHCFAVQLLLRITIAFVSIVTALFMIAINFSQSMDETQINLNLLFTLWATSSALEVWCVVWVTSYTAEEANKSPKLLHRIRNGTQDKMLQNIIEKYSLQMFHNKLQFTVCGLFPLDYTLLYTIVAGVTTYLVILIQFNNTDFLRKASANATMTTISP